MGSQMDGVERVGDFERKEMKRLDDKQLFKIKLIYLLTSGHGTSGLRDKPISRSLAVP
jgi:hypothetical protein